MLNILGRIWKNKIFVVIAILIIITFPSTLYMQSDKDKTIVTSAIGIDKNEDNYEITILAVIPKGSDDINSNLEIFSSSGQSISEALDTISLDLGKKIGLAHCDSIIFSQKLMDENLTLIFDYFIRTANLSTNPTLVATPDSAKDLLSAIKSSNNLLDLSLKNIIDSQEDRTMLDNVTIDRFYRAYLSHNSTFAIPILSVQDSTGEKSESGGESSQESSSQGGESSGGSEKSKQIKNNNDIAIVRDGKFVATLTEEEKFIYNLLTNPSSYQKFVLKNVTDENVTDSTVILQEADKIIIPSLKFKDGKPSIEYKIWLSVMLDEIIGKDNHSYASLNGIKNFLTTTIKEKFNSLIEENLSKTIESMQENKYDVLNVYSKYNAFKYGDFQKYLSSLDNPIDYMTGVDIKIDVSLNYVI